MRFGAIELLIGHGYPVLAGRVARDDPHGRHVVVVVSLLLPHSVEVACVVTSVALLVEHLMARAVRWILLRSESIPAILALTLPPVGCVFDLMQMRVPRAGLLLVHGIILELFVHLHVDVMVFVVGHRCQALRLLKHSTG